MASHMSHIESVRWAYKKTAFDGDLCTSKISCNEGGVFVTEKICVMHSQPQLDVRCMRAALISIFHDDKKNCNLG